MGCNDYKSIYYSFDLTHDFQIVYLESIIVLNKHSHMRLHGI